MNIKKFHDTKGDIMDLQNSSNHAEHPRAPKWILFGIACAVILCFVAIAAGLVINDDGTGPRAAEVFSSWIDFFTGNAGQADEDAESMEDAAGGENEVDRADEDAAAETGETPRHAAHLALSGPDEIYGPDDVVIFRRYSQDMSDEFGFGVARDLAVRFRGEDGTYTEQLLDGKIRCFLIVGDMLFYTILQDEGTRTTALCCKNLVDSQEPECLIESGVTPEFVYYDDSIWYVSRNDGSRLYRFELETGRNIRISDAEVGCYDLWEDTVYYENVSDRTLCKMRLDGTGNEVIEVPHHGESGVWLFQLSVCPYSGNIYLACMTGLGNSLLLFAEDGSAECWIEEEFGAEINQGFYYQDGLLYYSTGWIHVFDFERYFHGSESGSAGSYDVIFPYGEEPDPADYEAFEVTDEFVFMKMRWGPQKIKVYDRLTGELVEEIDCLAE